MRDYDHVAKKITAYSFFHRASVEVHQPEMRGRAICKVVLGSTVGAIVGPLLVGPTGELAKMAGLPELSRPYGVGFVVLVLAAILILSGLRPEPRDFGRELSRIHAESGTAQETRSLSAIVRPPGVLVAMVTMVFAQMVMVVPMSITSVHMKTRQHPLSMVSLRRTPAATFFYQAIGEYSG